MKQTKSINQPQGPRTGNAGTESKRDAFIKMRSTGEKQELADMVMDKLAARNPVPYIDNKVEPIAANVGPKRNPTAGGTHYNQKKPAPAPRPGRSAARIAK
jgi:hypothetical protein